MHKNKTASQIFLKQEKYEDNLAISTLNKFYMDNIIMPYKKSEKIIDMHTHTKYSDGDLSPDELIRLAIEKRIGVLSITDHDTIEGIKQLDRNQQIIKDSEIKIINGIELSNKTKQGTLHILGYGIDINDEKLNKKTEELKDNSIDTVLSILHQIKKDYDIRFSYNDIKQLINSNHNIGRPDIAKLCVKYGYAKTVQEAFDKYLIDAYEKIRSSIVGLTYEESIALITQSKGIPVLAHPKSIYFNEKEFLILLKNMIDCGLKGIEVYHSSHTKEEMKYYLEIAKKYNLLISGGSDYHGSNIKPNVSLGTGKNNNIKIKELSLLNNL